MKLDPPVFTLDTNWMSSNLSDLKQVQKIKLQNAGGQENSPPKYGDIELAKTFIPSYQWN